MDLYNEVGKIKGIGPAREKILLDKGIRSSKNLLNYLPSRYDDSSHIVTIDECYKQFSEDSIWEIPQKKVAIKAVLSSVTKFRTRSRLSIITGTIADLVSDKKMKVIWFNQEFIFPNLIEGAEYVWFGKVKPDKGQLSLQAPQFEKVIEGKALVELGCIVPIYRRTKKITTKIYRKLIAQIIPQLSIREFLPTSVLTEKHLMPLDIAYKTIHSPKSIPEIAESRRRIEIQELLEIKVEYEKLFKKTKLSLLDTIISDMEKDVGTISNKLSFNLTEGQKSALNEILVQLKSGYRLDSLIYGDVGSGKTIIALLIAFALAKAGRSTILIAPTTILAEQHVRTVYKYVGELKLSEDIKVVHVKKGESLGNNLADSPKLYIGTHAILHRRKVLADKNISFVCIDEQHRFGVEQRALLDPKRKRHVITLSATPIPRSLAISFLGFSQVIFIHGKPKGRKDIVTKVVPFDKEEVTYQWIHNKVAKGGRAYFVFPRIEIDDDEQQHSLLSSVEKLKSFFPGIKVAILHGRIKEDKKKEIMNDFTLGKIQILFSTSVIEVGIDVPEATIIAIHGADLFGLAQLHQLRGRVGRSSMQSFCFLFPGENKNQDVLSRLNFFSDHFSGMDIAEYDLANRGMGTIAGIAQSGLSELKIATFDNITRLQTANEIFDKLRKDKIVIKRYVRDRE